MSQIIVFSVCLQSDCCR